MTILHGTGVSSGLAAGPLFFLTRPNEPVPEAAGSGPAAEEQRYRAARQEAAAQLNRLAEECRAQSGEEAALLFETHALFAEDEEFTDRVLSLIRAEKSAAEYAVQTAAEEFAGRFAAMDDEYMQARAADVRDVAGRIISLLTGRQNTAFAPDRPVILAADDLAPSETVRLDRSKILAILTRGGSPSSHTAILARTMAIPAVCGLGEALQSGHAGLTALVDGTTGRVVMDPDESERARHSEAAQRQQQEKALLEGLKDAEDVTPDGRRIDVLCNIGSTDDLPAALESGARGIGLFRSEFLYLGAQTCPDEETQFAAYRAAASEMRGKRVVIRTLDVGADKQADCFLLKKEENPALGLRAVRICLTRPDVFRTQLRAILRASAFGRVSVMFPMIASAWEVRECRRMLRSAMEELEREGIPFDRAIEAGVMIETPASVLIADELAREADFFSVGTNDLTQYLLACDRQMSSPNRFYDPRHPALLRALAIASEAAHRAGIWIGVCGELAAEADMLPFFLSLGIDELSVPPAAVLPLRQRIRSFRQDEKSQPPTGIF